MNTKCDIVIIGGGPAGLTAAQYVARANMDVILVEAMALGGQTLLIEGLENYPGIPEPVNGFEFISLMEKQARQFGAKFLNAKVNSLTRRGPEFTLQTSKEEISCTSVILCTGAHHKKLGIPGEEEFSGKGVSYCATCDGPFFRDKKILVVGGGDAACDEAMFLAKISDKIVHIHRKDRFRAQRSLAQRVITEQNISVRFNTELKEILGDDKVTKAVLYNNMTREETEEDFDAVFIFIGSIPQNDLVPELEKDSGGYICTDQRMESAYPGLFVAGDVRSTPFRQIVVASGEGAVAAHEAVSYVDEIRGHSYY